MINSNKGALMNYFLVEQIFAQIKVLWSVIAIVINTSTQRRYG